VALFPGAAGFLLHRQALQRDDVHVLVIGEAREWETVEYVADAMVARQTKALVIIGHISVRTGGNGGVRALARGLRHGSAVEFVPAADAFWQPR
jgi:hypothetical protein